MSLLSDLKRLQKVLQAVNDRYTPILPSDDTVTLTWAASKGSPIDTEERQRLLDHLDKMLGESPSTRRH